MTAIDTADTDTRLRRVREALGDRLVTATDAGYDELRTPWNVAIDQRPLAVVRPESTREVIDVVRAASAAGLRVAPQATGHMAAGLSATDLSEVILVDMSALRSVTVDPTGRTARIDGGATWNDVLAQTAPHGLTALHGSAGSVGVVGYLLGGGLSFYGRAHGLAVGDVRAIEVVTADGSLHRAGPDEDAELFWALRGGSGAFGVVVALTISLRPLATVVAGMLLWDASRADEVTRAWSAWTRTAPDEATTALRIMNFPPMPDLPPFLSGRSVVVIDGAILGSDAAASALLGPLRALAPEVDTFARIPSADLIGVHMDPPGPAPAVTAHSVLDGLPAAAADAFVEAGSIPGIFVSELRHIGGAFAQSPAGGGAVASLPGEYIMHTIAIVPAPEMASPLTTAVREGVGLLDRWRIDALALTFIDAPDEDRALGFGPAARRLQTLKGILDPGDLFVAGNPVAQPRR
ncbi:Mitomycin radical oxidase [Microbacterium lemovicicum]|uniref:Mitomycin radical oxidase n=1 Tax=Microbacterium lemovicicum TaxID=1072463 RepID=A0A3S9WCT9_9MICO|nr:FAD-binding oxidoreductase [Microbacterium lemovicicum]AZS37886.1 Mitomycin radical oxidase [Microbacterium lemovicicum]